MLLKRNVLAKLTWASSFSTSVYVYISLTKDLITNKSTSYKVVNTKQPLVNRLWHLNILQDCFHCLLSIQLSYILESLSDVCVVFRWEYPPGWLWFILNISCFLAIVWYQRTVGICKHSSPFMLVWWCSRNTFVPQELDVGHRYKFHRYLFHTSAASWGKDLT